MVDSADMIDINAVDEITIDTTSADGHIAITSAHTAGQSILISANADAAAELDIVAGIVTMDAQAGISLDAATDSNLTVTGSGQDLDIAIAGGSTQELRLTSAGTGNNAIKLNATAGGIMVDSADTLSLNSSAGVINMGNDDVDQNINIGTNGSRIITIGGADAQVRIVGTSTGDVTQDGTMTINNIATVNPAGTATNSQKIQIVGGNPAGSKISSFNFVQGTGYTNGTYNGVSTTSSGSGTDATFDVVVENNKITSCTIVTHGSGYAKNDTITLEAATIGGSSTNQITVAEVKSFIGTSNDTNTWSVALEGDGNTASLVLWYENKRVANFTPSI